MSRKLLFVLFSDDDCRINHAFLYANDLSRRGHEVRVIVEGAATRSLNRLSEEGSLFARLFAEAKERGILAGACQTASGGCSSDDPGRKVSDLVRAEGLPLLGDLSGHAGIGDFVAKGFEIVLF